MHYLSAASEATLKTPQACNISKIIVFGLVLLISPFMTGCSTISGSVEDQSSNGNDQAEHNDRVTIRGVVESRSDVQTIRDAPLPNVLVLAVPKDRFTDLLNKLDVQPKAPVILASLGSLEVPQTVLNLFIEDSFTSDPAGRFELQLEHGNYYLCLANISSPPLSSESPSYINGCGEFSVIDGKLWGELYISWGMGGVKVR